MNPEFENHIFSKHVSVENGTAKVKLPRCCNFSDSFNFYFVGNIIYNDYFHVNYVEHEHVISVDYIDEITEGEKAKITIFNINESNVNFNLFINDNLIMKDYELSDRLNISLPKLSVGKHKIVIKSSQPAKGEIVTFKFNNKIYKVKTNSKGIAKLKIKNSVLNKLKVGKTPYKAKYSNQTVKK